MTLKKLKVLIKEFEKDGKHCMGVNLPKNIAEEVRHELYCLYGSDPGECLTTIYGVEVLSTDAKVLNFEE